MTDRRMIQESKIERIKRSSKGLRGGIARTLANGAAHFESDDQQLLKFHGIYQQDDRDLRASNRAAGLERAWSLMVRLQIPGGQLTPEQYLELDALADSHGDGSLRLTTRQSVQFHRVMKCELRSLIHEIDAALLTTLSACGDVQRNVMACPAPIADEAHGAVRKLAREIAHELMPATRAYFEIWLDGERVHTTEQNEAFYGERYLPRKFKTGIALATDNSVDIYAYDCGLVGITKERTLEGFNLLAGGGFGMTHRKPDTIARLASVIGFVRREHAVDAVRAVASVFRDHGNRADRRHARLKYLIEEWGVDRFREVLCARIDWELAPPREMPAMRQLDYLGPHEQGDGRQFYGVFIQSGRIRDRGRVRVRSAIREIVTRLRPTIHLTPMQSMLFGRLDGQQVEELVRILYTQGVVHGDALSNVRRFSMACPALPTCGVALADAERAAPDVLDAIGDELHRLGLDDVELNIRLTGCPNGCARPYNADIGIVGRKPGVYHVYVGGGLAGDRLADLYAADVAVDEIALVLRPLLQRFRNERRGDEGLGEFYQRTIGRGDRRTMLTGDELPTAELIQVKVC